MLVLALIEKRARFLPRPGRRQKTNPRIPGTSNLARNITVHTTVSAAVLLSRAAAHHCAREFPAGDSDRSDATISSLNVSSPALMNWTTSQSSCGRTRVIGHTVGLAVHETERRWCDPRADAPRDGGSDSLIPPRLVDDRIGLRSSSRKRSQTADSRAPSRVAFRGCRERAPFQLPSAAVR